MSAKTPKSKALIITTWIFLLLASGLPRIILQEIFGIQVSLNIASVLAAVVLSVGLMLTYVWKNVRELRSFFILFLILVGVEWLVYTKVNQLSFYETWLNNPSFNVFMVAEQSLRLLVTLSIIVALFILRKTRSAFFFVKGDTGALVEPVK